MYKVINQSFKIGFKYNIYFTCDIFDIKNKLILKIITEKKYTQKKVLIIIDKNVVKFHKNLINNINKYFYTYKNFIKLEYKPIIITGGEKLKNHYKIIKYFYSLINEFKICRQSYIIAIGGGSLLDMIGYLSSTAHRGIRLIRIPTTTLSQDDSGIGVKNGINFMNKKNFIGTFNVPFSVINDYKILTSLTKKLWLDGVSEAIKVSLIKNKNLFKFIENNIKELKNKNIDIMKKVIYESAKLHAKHISKCGDPFENLSSRPLDFGHWSAHKLESLTKFKMSHGESVAIGIALDSTYSYFIKLLKKHEWKKIIKMLKNLDYPIYTNKLEIKKQNNFVILKGLSEFKEHLGGKLTITLLKSIGNGINVNHINKNIVKKVIIFLKKIEYFYKKSYSNE